MTIELVRDDEYDDEPEIPEASEERMRADEERIKLVMKQMEEAPPPEQRVRLPRGYLGWHPFGHLVQIPLLADLKPHFRYVTLEEAETLEPYNLRDIPHEFTGVDSTYVRPRFRKLDGDDYTRMNLPKTHWNSRVSGIVGKPQEVVLKYIDRMEHFMRKNVCFWIPGNPESGKSSIAISLAKAVVASGKTAYYTSARGLGVAYEQKQMFSEDLSVRQRVQDVDMLVVDDLSIANSSGAFMNAELLTDLVRSRAMNYQPTVVVSTVSSATEMSILLGAFPKLLDPQHRPSYVLTLTAEGDHKVLGAQKDLGL